MCSITLSLLNCGYEKTAPLLRCGFSLFFVSTKAYKALSLRDRENAHGNMSFQSRIPRVSYRRAKKEPLSMSGMPNYLVSISISPFVYRLIAVSTIILSRRYVLSPLLTATLLPKADVAQKTTPARDMRLTVGCRRRMTLAQSTV